MKGSDSAPAEGLASEPLRVSELREERRARWKSWGDVFNHYLRKGHDHGSAAYAADQWEGRQ